jgi:hypothetical protein
LDACTAGVGGSIIASGGSVGSTDVGVTSAVSALEVVGGVAVSFCGSMGAGAGVGSSIRWFTATASAHGASTLAAVRMLGVPLLLVLVVRLLVVVVVVVVLGMLLVVSLNVAWLLTGDLGGVGMVSAFRIPGLFWASSSSNDVGFGPRIGGGGPSSSSSPAPPFCLLALTTFAAPLPLPVVDGASSVLVESVGAPTCTVRTFPPSVLTCRMNLAGSAACLSCFDIVYSANR